MLSKTCPDKSQSNANKFYYFYIPTFILRLLNWIVSMRHFHRETSIMTKDRTLLSTSKYLFRTCGSSLLMGWCQCWFKGVISRARNFFVNKIMLCLQTDQSNKQFMHTYGSQFKYHIYNWFYLLMSSTAERRSTLETNYKTPNRWWHG